MPWIMMKREPFSEPETEEEGGQKLTIFQSDRKKGGEGGEAGVVGDDFFGPKQQIYRLHRLFS